MRLVLASASPRRAWLLTQAGYNFDVAPAKIDERRLDGEHPKDYVMRLGRAKAEAAATRFPERVVLGADTVVVIDGVVLGKPSTRAGAERMLNQLSGRSHEVLTGVVIVSGARRLDGLEVTRVTFAELSAAKIEWYVGTGESADKAGAYAVQGVGSRFVERIEGSYTNVVGLPIPLVDRLLCRLTAISGTTE